MPPQVLRTCAQVPAVIEVLFNSYTHLRVSESWQEVIPEDVYQVRSCLHPFPMLQNSVPLTSLSGVSHSDPGSKRSKEGRQGSWVVISGHCPYRANQP